MPQILSRLIGTKFFFILSLSVSICFTSCNESSVVGLDVQPANDLLNVGFEDTTSINTRTVKGDSLITDETLISNGNGLIGKYIDPVFGTSTASIYTQLRLPTNIVAASFGIAPVCDSIIISLIYEGTAYGKKDKKQQKLNVYQLSESMSTASTYYSNSTLSKFSTDLTAADGYVFQPRTGSSTSDSVTVLGVKLKPQLRVPLDNAFGQLLLNNQGTGNIATNTDFQNFFKGVYITTENTSTLPGEGNILHFKFGESKVTLYYHNSTTDSLKYDFNLGSVARFNHFEHDYTGASTDLTTQFSTPTQTQNNTVYVQSMAGAKTKIEFPHLMNWVKNGMIGVNKAELVISVDTTVSTYMIDTFAAPAALILFGINDDGTTYAIPDAFEGATYFGGTLNSGTVQYRFNIARYIQQVLDGDRNNNGLYILASNGAVYGNRAVISGGPSTSARPMKLNITYTKLH
jgi:hypothetical protein